MRRLFFIALKSVFVDISTLPNLIAFEPTASQSNKFIAGAPMKYPTKVVLGRSNNSAGEPICTISPSSITMIFSAKVIASF